MQIEAPYRFVDIRNLLTYLSLASAVAAMVGAHSLGPRVTGGLIALSVVLDVFDGKFAARFTRPPSASAFGVQLDSFVDAIAFGCAPLAASYAMLDGSRLASIVWWPTALFYLTAVLTRLAFYNLYHSTLKTFVGLPASVPALIFSSLAAAESPPIIIATSFGLTGAAMLAPISIPRARGVVLLGFLGWTAVLIVIALYDISRRSH